jgi:hypothetical protein
MRFGKPVGVIAAFAFVVNANASSAKFTDPTDLWWNPSESGWGLQMVNTGTFIYATIYVYGPDGKPVWFAGGLDSVDGLKWSGPLYTSMGPYFGGASFDSAAVTVRQVGQMTLTISTINSGQITYSVDGVTVSKTIQRQPLTLDNYTGSYSAIFAATVTGCTSTANNGSRNSPVTVNITQIGNSMSMAWAFADGNSCASSGGAYSQLGRKGLLLNANYSCNTGEVGTLILAEMNAVPNMFTTRMRASSSNIGCVTDGEMAGVIPH